MQFLLAPLGSIGDVYPYLGIGVALRDRGHTVTLVTNDRFASLATRLELEFAATGTAAALERFYERREVWSFAQGWKHALRELALGTMRRMYDIIAERYEPGRMVVAGPGMAFGARIAQERLGVPMATVHLEPDKFRSVYRSPVMPPPLVLADWVPKISKRVQLWIADRLVIDRVVSPELNAFRAELGLPPVRRVVADWWNSPQRVIGAFPDWFCSPQPDWPAQTFLTGFPMWDRSESQELPDEIDRFLCEGEPPVVFTFGSEMPHAKRLYEAAVAACRTLGCRGALITKHAEQLPSDLPEGVRHFSFVPFSQLLSHASAIVHHAGIGTAAQSLAAGVPQVVVPMSFCQPDTASHLARLEAGIVVKPRQATGPNLADALGRLLASRPINVRCRELASQSDDWYAIDRICDLLEELVGSDVGAMQYAEMSAC